MKVLVLGAAGRTGRAVVSKAKADGHQVTAFVRDREGYDEKGVRVVEGDATDPTAVDAAVAGQDAVIDTIAGKTPYKRTALETSTATAVIESMKRHHVQRLIATSVIGEGESRDNTPTFEKLLFAVFLRGANKDKASMEAAVEASGLDWTIVRPAVLSDGPAVGDVKIYSPDSGEKAHRITRQDLAAFMVAELDQGDHIRQAVVVANR